MRQAMQDDIDGEMSHISDMLDHARTSATTLRFACMVLIALRACSLSEANNQTIVEFLFFTSSNNCIINCLYKNLGTSGNGYCCGIFIVLQFFEWASK